MYKYQIKKGGVSYMIKSDQNITGLKYNPALFFLCDGDYEINVCGQLTAFKQLRNHIANIAKKLVTINV